MAFKQANNLMTDAVHPEDFDSLRADMHQVLFERKPMDHVFRVFHEVKQEYIWLRMQVVAKAQNDGTTLIDALVAALQNGDVDAIVSSNLRATENEWVIATFNPSDFYAANFY